MVEKKMSGTHGIVYIAWNVTFSNHIKIGKTRDIEGRMKTLSGTAVPAPYSCLFAFEIKNYGIIEKSLLGLLRHVRVKNKEFLEYKNQQEWEVDVEYIKNLMKNQKGFKDVTKKGNKHFKKITPEEKKSFEEEQQKATRKENFNFKMLGIDIGTYLVFIMDDNIKCQVVDNKKVEFEGEKQTLSKAALTVLHRKGHRWERASGSYCWKYQGETLIKRRMRLEEEET